MTLIQTSLKESFSFSLSTSKSNQPVNSPNSVNILERSQVMRTDKTSTKRHGIDIIPNSHKQLTRKLTIIIERINVEIFAHLLSSVTALDGRGGSSNTSGSLGLLLLTGTAELKKKLYYLTKKFFNFVVRRRIKEFMFWPMSNPLIF